MKNSDMMEIKSEGSRSYTIPLDSMDLKYLSKYVHTLNTEKRPLWTKKCLDGESEYCHVQIVTHDDNEDCYSEETFDTYNCHICNVEVPALCFKRHNESDKHVTLKTIFQKVLERVSKQINRSVINNDKDIDKDVYYCVTCSKIIKIENKLKHESSEYHVKSQRGINVVHEFYKIFQEMKAYVGIKEVENEEILDENRDLSVNNFGTEIIQNDTKNNNNLEKSNNDETKAVCSTNDNAMKPPCTVEHWVSNDKSNNELSSEENYFKDMVKKYNLKVNLPIVDGEFIHVASPSGVKVKISQDHFHSYLTVVRGIRIYCQMCNKPVELGQESKHKVSEEHARNVFIPVNEQFARPFNDYISHCLICNKVILTSRLSEQHLYNDNHVKLFNSTKLTDICQNNEDLANNIIKENNIERTHSENHTIENHVNNSEENKTIKCINNKEYISKINLSENDSGDHLNESCHIARTKDAISDQKLVVCKLCNVSVPQDQMEYHNAGTPHWSNALKKICTGVADGLQAYFSKDNLKTDSDSSTIPNDTPNIDNFTNQNETTKNDNVTNENQTPKNDNVASTSISNITNNEIDSASPFRYVDSTKNKVTCIVCDVDIANVLQSVKKHEESSNHNVFLGQLLHIHTIKKNPKRSFCECCCDTNVTNIWAHIGTEQHTAMLQLEYVLNLKALKLYNYKSNIRDHNGILFRELYKMLLECNKIYKLPNSNFYCTFCELELSEEGNEIDHMFSAEHEKWIKIISKSH